MDNISHYGPDGTTRGLFGSSGGGPGQFDAPSGIAVTAGGVVSVTDFYNHRVQLFREDGTFIRKLGKQGPSRGHSADGLNYPTRVKTASDGSLWISDAYNHRIVSARLTPLSILAARA